MKRTWSIVTVLMLLLSLLPVTALAVMGQSGSSPEIAAPAPSALPALAAEPVAMPMPSALPSATPLPSALPSATPAPVEGPVEVAAEPASEGAFTAVTINSLTFPDKAFRDYVAGELDGDRDGVLSSEELAAVTVLDIPNLGIEDLTGVAHFANLESLNCADNRLTALDLSGNLRLVNLEAGSNQYEIRVRSDRAFDMSVLPGGFDPSRTSNWAGGSARGYILWLNENTVIASGSNLGGGQSVTDSNLSATKGYYVRYNYDCGNGLIATLTLKVIAIYGDADGNGKVNARDATLVLRLDAGSIQPAQLVYEACDVDGNGKVNARDATLILRRDAGVITHFPVDG